MSLVEDHIARCGLDPDMLETFIELYNHNIEVDPNRKSTGVDIFRNFEYGYPLQWLKPILNESSRVLDIGSSSTIWPAMLYKIFKCQIHATDIDMDHLETQKHYLYNIGALDELGKKFKFEYQDATAMTYEDNSFDVVCSISAIEHIPGEGDIRAVEEAQRVLKPGGLFIFTAPYYKKFSESVTDHYHHGYEKRYDVQALITRFLSAPKLKRINTKYINGINEQSDQFNDFWYNQKLYNTLGQISMLLSLKMYEITSVPTDRTRGFIALYKKTP